MKNLKRLLGLMAISGFAFGFANVAYATGDGCVMPGTSSSGDKCVATVVGEGSYKSLNAAISAITTNNNIDGGTINLLDDTSLQNDGTISEDITINIGKYNLTIPDTKHFNVGGQATLTIKGTGKITANSTATDIASISKGSELVLEGSYELNAVNQGTLINTSGDVTVKGIKVKAPSATSLVNIQAQGLTITLNANVGEEGTPGIKGLVAVDAGLAAKGANDTAAKVEITGGAYYTSAQAIGAAKDMELSISGGTIAVETGRAITMSDANVKISGGTIKANDSVGVIVVDTATDNERGVLTISGGTITNTNNNSGEAYAIYFNSAKGTYKITGGTFEGGKQNKTQTPAIFINNAYLTGMLTGQTSPINIYKGFITGGKFLSYRTNQEPVNIIGSAIINGVTKSVDDVVKYVVNGTVTDNANYKVVGTTQTTDPETQKPGSTTGDDTPGKNPQTYDGIMSYVTLAISSLGALGIATKKVLF